MPQTPRRHFLSWDRPLLPQAVAFLAGDWAGPAPLDLSHVLAVVPTRQSGRRLREALAEFSARHASAAFPPRVLTPEALAFGEPDPQEPTHLEALLGWIEVLRDLDPADFPDVFPVAPPPRSFSWALHLGEQLLDLQKTLFESGLRIIDVPELAGDNLPEIARWQQLAELERRQCQRLATAGRRARPPGAADRTRPPAWLGGIQRIVFLAVPDPLPAAVDAVTHWAGGRAVEIVVYAPERDADRFDAWGRPTGTSWAARAVALPAFEKAVHVCVDPIDQARRVVELVQAYGAADADGKLGVGVADPDVLAAVVAEANRVNVPVFSPEGRPRAASSLYPLLAALRDAARSRTFESLEALARCPDFLAWLASRTGPRFSSARFLEELDDLRRNHLPPDLDAAARAARGELAAALAVVTELLERLAEGDFPDAVLTALSGLFRPRRVDTSVAADAGLHDAAGAWMTVVRDCTAAKRAFSGLGPDEWWELALRAFGRSRGTAEKPARAVEVLGRLELLYEDAPHLVVAGVNDGAVPEALSDDPFLPDSLRRTLGLRHNAARLARDAYLLDAIVAPRIAGGSRVDLLLGKTSASGDPLRPSRLLFRCDDSELPVRVACLFRAPEPAESHLPWSRAWRVRPPRVPPPAKVAVTALKRWLVCPFRFYLRHVLRLEAVDAAKSEMDAFDFGTLCHAALEAMGREEGLRHCTEPERLRDFLLAELTRHARGRFGAVLTLPLQVQLESARQRLSKLAEVQAAERAAGWVIEEVERAISVDVGGLIVSGKIDRIDRNEHTGAVRVVDYKTSDTAVNPRTAHLRPARVEERAPEWSRVMVDDKARVWTDLQLPVYRHALAGQWGGTITCGYLNLPKATGQTAAAIWDDYTPELHESAMRCVDGVCAAIRAGEFWPPNEEIRPENDDFASLFHHGVAASVEWRGTVVRPDGGESPPSAVHRSQSP